jgi:cytochrome c biogenesis protein ResB
VAKLISVYRKEVMVHEQWVFPFNTDMTQTEGQTGIFDFKVKKITPVYETVIQSIRDPGLGFVMSGFALMFWGLIMLGVKKKA